MFRQYINKINHCNDVDISLFDVCENHREYSEHFRYILISVVINQVSGFIKSLQAGLTDPDSCHLTNQETVFGQLILTTIDKWKRLSSEAPNKSLKGMRFPQAIIQFGLSIFNRSRQAYLELSDIFALPSESTMSDYARSMSLGSSETISAASLLHLKSLTDNNSREGMVEHGLLIQDAMIIKKGIVYNEHSKRIDGYSDLESISDIIQGRHSTEILSKYSFILA
jgi:hypothetical protein